jgi:hypothetical protein
VFHRKPKEPTPLEKAIDALVEELDTVTGDSKEYTAMSKNIVELHKAKYAIPAEKSKLSPDVVLTVAANLAGILLILNYEQVHAATSKAMGFILKPRVS